MIAHFPHGGGERLYLLLLLCSGRLLSRNLLLLLRDGRLEFGESLPGSLGHPTGSRNSEEFCRHFAEFKDKALIFARIDLDHGEAGKFRVGLSYKFTCFAHTVAIPAIIFRPINHRM